MHTPKSDAEEIEETGRDGRNEDEGDDRRGERSSRDQRKEAETNTGKEVQ